MPAIMELFDAGFIADNRIAYYGLGRGESRGGEGPRGESKLGSLRSK
jgi:hypothetical protein